MNGSRPLSPPAREAARLLGLQIRLGRKERGWTVKELATRVGVTEVTLRKVERGDPTVALGTAFEAATLAGVPLFHDDPGRRALEVERVTNRLALLPASVRRRTVVDDNF